MPIRLAVLVSHPIQYFAPWHREMAKTRDIDQKVYFCSEWGAISYVDPEFSVDVKWDVPLLDGYAYEFLPIRRAPKKMGFFEIDNPAVVPALDRFDPDVLMLFGYGHRTNWRAANWAKRHQKPVLLYSDSNAKAVTTWWKRAIKELIVRHFYSKVDGAFYVGENNRQYHVNYGGKDLQLFPGVLPVERERLLSAVPDRAQTRDEVRKSLGIPRDAFVVMFCGKFASHKRPLDVVAAGHGLAQKGAPVWTLLVGEGPERGAIENFCRRQQVRQNVITGFVNQSRIPSYYAAADVIALSSSRDNHPLTVTEAATFGLPVVTSDQVGCIGPEDTARPGRNAIVYPCGDVEELAAAIEMLQSNPALYLRMSQESLVVSASQDVVTAAGKLGFAVRQLHERSSRSKQGKPVHSPLEDE